MKTFSLLQLSLELGGRLSSEDYAELQIQSVCANSRQAQEDALFVAYKGVESDGHKYLDQAFESGCAAAVVSNEAALAGRPGIIVENGRASLSRLAYLFSNRAADSFLTIGITGTNGKTTIHWLLYHALNKLGRKTLRIGTLGYACPEMPEATSMVTTPDALALHSLLEKAAARGANTCVIETSSHALDQCRVDDLHYHIGVFTHLTPDHLHYHGNMQDYFLAKLKLFELLEKDLKNTLSVCGNMPGGAVVNADCPYGKQLIDWLKQRNIPTRTFGWGEEADIQILDFEQTALRSKTHLRVSDEQVVVASGLIGRHNAENIATAAAVLSQLGFSASNIAQALSDLPGVPGRLEFFGTEEKAVYVDYAHTGDAMSHVLKTLREVTRGKLWVLFGAGGGKDPLKRKLMGEAAASFADCIVLTADNPKHEDPGAIISEIAQSCQPTFVEHDRHRAIERALRELAPGDTLLIAGKGHEDYQIIGDQTFHFSDREEMQAFRESGIF